MSCPCPGQPEAQPGAGGAKFHQPALAGRNSSPTKDRGVILADGNAPDGLTLAFTNRFANALEKFRCPAR